MRYTLTMEEVARACAKYLAKQIGKETYEFDVSIFGRVENGKVVSMHMVIEDKGDGK